MNSEWVRVRNNSDIRRRINHMQLPGGYVTLDPGEETLIRKEIYVDVRRTTSTWLLNMDAAPPSDAPAPEPAGTVRKRKGKANEDNHAVAE